MKSCKLIILTQWILTKIVYHIPYPVYQIRIYPKKNSFNFEHNGSGTKLFHKFFRV